MSPLRRHPRIPDRAALAALVALGAVPRFFRIGEESLWIDEAYSLRLATASGFGEIARATAGDVHPPLYYWLLHLWGGVFGDSVAALRAMSAVASLATIPLVHAIARPFAGGSGALFAAALFAISPYHVWYAQEMRMYAPLVLFECAMALCALRIAVPSEDSAASSSGEERRSRMRRSVAWFGLCVASVAAILTHFYFPFLCAGAAGVLAWGGAVRPERRREIATGFVLWTGACLAAAAPGVRQAWSRATEGTIDWIPPLSLDTARGILHAFAYGVFLHPKPAWWLWVPTATIGIALAAAAFGRRAEAGSSLVPVGILFAATFVLPILVSFFRPVVFYGQRYLIVATPFFFVLVAAGWKRLGAFAPGVRLRAGWLVAAPLVFAISSGMYCVDLFDGRQKRPFDLAARLVDGGAREGQIVVVEPPSSLPCLEHYLREPHRGTVFEELARIPSGELAGKRVWVASILSEPAGAELALREMARAGKPHLFECEDMPGMTVRVQSYDFGG